MKFGTKVIHSGLEIDPSTGAIITPIYQTSTYVQKKPGKHLGFEYSRTKNPTKCRKVLQLLKMVNLLYLRKWYGSCRCYN